MGLNTRLFFILSVARNWCINLQVPRVIVRRGQAPPPPLAPGSPTHCRGLLTIHSMLGIQDDPSVDRHSICCSVWVSHWMYQSIDTQYGLDSCWDLSHLPGEPAAEHVSAGIRNAG